MLLSTLRYLLTLTFLLLLNSTLHAQGSLARLDEQNGLRGAVLDTDLAVFQHLVSEQCSTAESAEVSCYSRSTDTLTLGAATLQKIQYTFYKNSLAAITVTLQGTKNIAAFCAALQEAYGNGAPSAESVKEVEWNGERVHMAYNVLKGEAKQEPILRLVLRSKAQMIRYQADQLQARRVVTTEQTTEGL